MGTTNGDPSLPAIKAPSGLEKALRILERVPLTEAHVDKIIDACSRVAELHMQRATLDAQSANAIRMMMARFHNDSSRCENAVNTLREFADRLPDELIGQLVELAIKVQLGVSPEKL